ncbi:MAG TPA: DUF134 domain-containing protein [Desulfobacteraceae bacterium]|nr:DUF134 domain-containing protein [Desulfobacteraceae bacterium]
MVRPVINRKVGYKPEVNYFKPRGIPMTELIEVVLTVDEREAVRLADLEGMSHDEGGRQMGVSRATFGRILKNARNTIADAVINGKAIDVQGGHYEMVTHSRMVSCRSCRHRWKEPCQIKKENACPLCQGSDIEMDEHER